MRPSRQTIVSTLKKSIYIFVYTILFQYLFPRIQTLSKAPCIFNSRIIFHCFYPRRHLIGESTSGIPDFSTVSLWELNYGDNLSTSCCNEDDGQLPSMTLHIVYLYNWVFVSVGRCDDSNCWLQLINKNQPPRALRTGAKFLYFTCVSEMKCFVPCLVSHCHLTLSLPAYHCRQWKCWCIYVSPVAKGLINPFATTDAYMRQLFHCLQWYAGSERVNMDHSSRNYKYDHNKIMVDLIIILVVWFRLFWTGS